MFNVFNIQTYKLAKNQETRIQLSYYRKELVRVTITVLHSS